MIRWCCKIPQLRSNLSYGENRLVFQSLWAFETQTGIDYPDSLARIKQAGFDGVSDHFLDPKRLDRLYRDRDGLAVEGCIFPRNLDDIRAALSLARDYPLRHLNAQVDFQPRRLAEALAFLRPALALAEAAGVPLLIETHRGRLTSDLFFTLDLLEDMPDLPLLIDLSHYVVAREITLPVAPQMSGYIRRLLENAQAFHGRIASCEQVQIAPFAPHNAPWLAQFCDWWAQGFAAAKARGQRVSFTYELGPAPYAARDAQGAEHSDRWADAQRLGQIARDLWCAA